MQHEKLENGVLLIARAADFAARAHVTQRRKGDAQEPYVNHLIEVALLLTEATGGENPVVIAAGCTTRWRTPPPSARSLRRCSARRSRRSSPR
jgi:hypothetical protein